MVGGVDRRGRSDDTRAAPATSTEHDGLADDPGLREPSASTLPRTTSWWLALSAAWLVSAVYAGALLMRGWVPHDEGTFGETALRVLQGQLPHRDFEDVYTGGLSYLHALTFHLLGISSASLRLTLYACFLAWV